MNQQEKQEHMLETAHKEYGNGIRVISAEKNVLHFATDDKSITYTCHNNGRIDVSSRWRRGHKPGNTDNAGKNGSEPSRTKTETVTDKISGTVPVGRNHIKNADPAENKNEGIHQLTFDDILSTDKEMKENTTHKSQAEPEKSKRHRRTRAEIQAAQGKTGPNDMEDRPVPASEDFMNPPVKAEDSDIPETNGTDTAVRKKRHRRTKAEMAAARQVELAGNTNTEAELLPEHDQTVNGVKNKKTEDPSPLTDTEDEKIVFDPGKPNPFSPGESVELIYGNHTAYTVLECLGNTCRVAVSSGEWTEYTVAASDLRKSTKKARAIEE